MFLLIFSPVFLFHSVDGFCTEPVGIKVRIAKGAVQADGSFVPVHNLKIRLCGAEAPSFFQNGLADGAGVIPVPVIRVDVDRVQPDVLPVQNSKAGGDDRSGSVADGSADCLLRNRPVHGGYDRAVHDVCGAFQGEKSFDPLQRNEIAGGDGDCRVQPCVIFQRAGHYMGGMLNLISAVLQITVKFRRDQGADLKDAGGSPVPVNILTVSHFFRKRKKGRPDLLDAVGTMCIKIRKAENPSIIDLHLVRRPRVQ